MSKDNNSLAHTKWNCKYHIVFAPKQNRQFWCKGYYISTVGANKEIIKNYIRNYLKEDMIADNISLKEHKNPSSETK